MNGPLIKKVAIAIEDSVWLQTGREIDFDAAAVAAIEATGVEGMADALKACRRYLTQFGSVTPNVLKQQIDDALEIHELREAGAGQPA